MKNTITALVLAAVLLPGPFVLAQDARGGRGSEAWAPVKHLRFTDDDVRGGLLGPEGELIEVVPRARESYAGAGRAARSRNQTGPISAGPATPATGRLR